MAVAPQYRAETYNPEQAPEPPVEMYPSSIAPYEVIINKATEWSTLEKAATILGLIASLIAISLYIKNR